VNGVMTVVIAGAGLSCGLVLGWFLARRNDAERAALRSKVEAFEAMMGELRRQIGEKDAALESLRRDLGGVQQAKTVAETKLEEMAKNIEAQKKLLDEAHDRLKMTFQALSGEALKSNNQAFLELAKESLGIVLSEAKGEFFEKQEAIKNIVKPLEDALQRYENQIGDLERSRITAYVSLEGQIKSLLSAEEQLKKETSSLVTALRRPEIRGRWGEVTLRRVVELAGMSQHCDYSEQVSVTTDEDERLRPDMIIHLPAEREIVVDSKVSLDAYLDAVSSDSEARRRELIARHAQQVRKHMKTLSEKNYWSQFPKAPEFVVMFMPAESFLSAALENDHALIEDGMKAKVIIATPTTLIALLRAIAYGWRQEQIAKNAQEIAQLGKEIYDRFEPFLRHVNKVRLNLSQAVFAFNRMTMSLERRVMVSVRKFKELGATGDKELSEIEPIEQIPLKPQDDGTLPEDDAPEDDPGSEDA